LFPDMLPVLRCDAVEDIVNGACLSMPCA
jgi:hypothetical protein